MLADRVTILALLLNALAFWHAGRRYERALRLDREIEVVARVARAEGRHEGPPVARVLPPVVPFDWNGDDAA